MKKYIEVFNTCEKLRRRLDELKTIVPPANYGEVVHIATLIIKFLQEQQPADVVEVKRGEWFSIQRGDQGYSAGVWNPTNEATLWKCSNCGCVIYSETERDITFNHAYCGRCGAEMSSFRKPRGES